MPQQANVPAQRTGRMNAFAAVRVTRWQIGLLPNYFVHLLLLHDRQHHDDCSFVNDFTPSPPAKGVCQLSRV